MKITQLPASSSFSSGDVLAIEVSGKTYKLTGATLAAALESIGNYVNANDLATTSADGLMSSTDKLKLNGIAAGAQVNTITGVKGNAESNYRTGNVNLTPANVGVNFTVYNSVTQLGLTSGSATILAAYNAMGASTILIAPAGDFASAEVPSTTGVVEIVKRASDGSRGYVAFHGKQGDAGDYRMFLGATSYNSQNYNAPSGEWFPDFPGLRGGTGETGKTLTVNVPSNSSHLLIMSGDSAQRMWAGIVTVYSSGNVGTMEITKGNDVTVTTSTNKVILTTGSTNEMTFMCLPIRRDRFTGYSVTA